MNTNQLFLPPIAVKILLTLAIVQVVREILPLEFDTYFLSFLGFNLFRGGELNLMWLYGSITSVFVHGGWLHLIANGTWIFVLTPQISPHLTDRRFFLFFIATAALGGLTHAIINWGKSEILVGASGAVFGLLGAGAYVMIRGRDGHSKPTARDFGQYVLVMMIVNIGYAYLGDGNVSWEAHAGGFFAGLALFPLMRHPKSSP